MPGAARAINPGGRVGVWAEGFLWAGAALAKSLCQRRSSAWKKETGDVGSAPRAPWGVRASVSARASGGVLGVRGVERRRHSRTPATIASRARLRSRSVAATGGVRHSQCTTTRRARRPMEDLGQSLCLAQLGLHRKRHHKLDATPHRVACFQECERIGVIVLQEGAHRAPG